MKDPLMAAQKDWVYKEAKLESEVQQVTSKLSSTKAKVSSLWFVIFKVVPLSG